MKTILTSLICAAIINNAAAVSYCTPTYSFGPDNYDNISTIGFTASLYGTTFGNYTHTHTEGVGYTDKTNNTDPADWGGTTFGKTPVTLDVTVSSIEDYIIYVGAWVDWNDDYDFEDPNELLGVITVYPFSGTGTANFSIAETITQEGVHRVRIRTTDSADPATLTACSAMEFGESVDFLISIVEKPYCYDNSTYTPNYITGIPVNSYNINGEIIPVNILNTGITYVDMAPEGSDATFSIEQGDTFDLNINYLTEMEGLPYFYLLYVDHNDNGSFESGYELLGFAYTTLENESITLTVPESFTPGTHNLRIRIAQGADLDICDQEWLAAGMVIDEKINILERATTAVQNDESETLSVYPNPVTDFLQINHSAGSENSFKICDITGAEISSGTLQGSTRIDVRQWSKGVYFLTLISENKSIQERTIIVQ